ncbi:MAG: short-chain dehydrogenase/reductase [Jatrophihabitans sp.]|uniref:short-chain dehydrogenase/reductase n=1 Tax=Jatrophihabitans sp. TaxID=1932789 RepID=UPI003F7FC04C
MMELVGESLRALTAMTVGATRQLPVVGAVLGPSDALSLPGKTVLITGAARGLGAEIARQVHARGANVVLVGRRLDGVQAVADELGQRALAAEADVSDFAALQRAAAAALEHFGGIDVVVANAGIAPPSDSVLSIDPDAFEHTVDIDLLGQWRTVRATLPTIVRRSGHIVVISSIYAFFNGALNASYAASKAGIEQLVRALRVELAHHGATAGVAYLGFIDTDLAADVFAREHVDEARRAIPGFLTKPMSTEAAAAAVVRGIEQRAGKIGAPGWVLPMLRARGFVTTLMDEALIRNARLTRVIRDLDAETLLQDDGR